MASRNPSLIKYLSAAQFYGKTCSELLVFLDENWGTWSYNKETEDVVFESQKKLEAFNNMTDKLVKAEVRFNEAWKATSDVLLKWIVKHWLHYHRSLSLRLSGPRISE